MLLLAFSLMCACAKQPAEPTSEISAEYARVNGEIITYAEAKYFEDKYRAEIIGDFLSEYTLEYSDTFWDTEINGTTPQRTLEKRVLAETVNAKIRLVLMREHGIYDDISFTSLREKAEAFNRAGESGQNKAGLRSIPLNSFYTYYIQTGDMQLEQLLGKTLLAPTENEISEYIESESDTPGFAADADARSIAADALVSEKYEEYISELIDNADIDAEY